MKDNKEEFSIRKHALFFTGAGVLLYLFLSFVVTSSYDLDIPWVYRVIDFCYTISITVLISIVQLKHLIWMSKKFPWNESPLRRITVQFFTTNTLTIGIMSLLLVIVFWSYPKDAIGGMTYRKVLAANLPIGFVMNLIINIVVEGNYFFQSWKKALLNSEELKKEKAKAELDSLKNQLNPHFLFNSLNTLSGLIHEDLKESDQFINDFSSIYRYVLDNEGNTKSLRDEIEFAQSYLFLQKKRFGEALQFQFNISEDLWDAQIPILSVQELLENAIKHNVVAKKRPLILEIYTENYFLNVKNNFQLRNEEVRSTHNGLDNLRKRYALLGDYKIEIVQTTEIFKIQIPLIF